jgi:hypothetical protein
VTNPSLPISTAIPTTTTPDSPIWVTLDALRRRIRWYVWVQGFGTTATWLGMAFWADLLVDWFFEPSSGRRLVLLLVVAGVVGTVLANTVIRRLLVPLTDANMAMLLERRFPQLDDTLLTTVSLLAPPGQSGATDGCLGQSEAMAQSPAFSANPCDSCQILTSAGRYSDVLLDQTARQAARRITALRLADVFNLAPLRQSVSVGAALLLSILVFGLVAPSSLGVWARRNFLLADELWPRQTRLEVEGFKDGMRKVARGADLEIIALADLTMPVVPRSVEVRYRSEGGSSGRAPMSREGQAAPGCDRSQRYSHTFRGVLSPIEFDLVGGDARLEGLRIEVVESPKIDELALRCEYPAYTALPSRRLPVIGPMPIPRGTRVVIEGRANKALARVRIDTMTDGAPAESVWLKPAGDSSDRRVFHYAMGPLDNDLTVLVTLDDADGIESPEPTRLAILAVADQPPELSMTLSGIGTAITPQARLPVAGGVRDDYGVAKVWFEYAVNERAPTTKLIAEPGRVVTELAVDDALDVRELGLTPGQKLLLRLAASDRYDLDATPRVGTGTRWLLDVVTPEQLRAMLQARELTLRYRFEQIIEEVSETRDLLAHVGPGAGEPSSRGAESPAGRSKGAEPEDRAAGREPGDVPAAKAPSADRQAEADALRVDRAVQNSRKNAAETLGTAEAFDDVRMQLINNRIDTEELRIRLKSGIADPLRAIAKEMFPELDRRLAALRDALGDDRLARGRRDAAKEQAVAILAAMNSVLGRMIELEDFNEAISLLEEIINLQKKLDEQTHQRHKAQLRDLLEEK